MQFILFFAARRHLCSIFLVTGCAKEIRKISISSLESLLEEQSLSTRDVGRFIGLLLETVRNRYPFQPLRLIVHVYIYIYIFGFEYIQKTFASHKREYPVYCCTLLGS